MKESEGESEKGEREKRVKLETSNYFSGYLRHFKLKWKKKMRVSVTNLRVKCNYSFSC